MGFSTAITAAVLAPSIVQSVQANQDRQHAKGAAQAEEDKQKKLLEDQKKAQAQSEADQSAAVARDQQKKRQTAGALAAGGRRSTILTGPLGVTTPQDSAQKTLLGS